jgi:DNA invertase Pin-like site-specific DNA recombinase
LNGVARIARNLAGALALAKRKKPEPARTGRTRKVGRPPFVFEDDDVVRLLKAAVEREGSQNAFARRHRVERSFLNKILKGKRPVSPTIAKALGLRQVYTAE